jgi:hypothetical protein
VPESPSNWDSEAGTRLWIRPGERLLWRGAPDPKVSFGPEDLVLIPFSLLWGIFWEYQASKLGWGFGSVWGIPFVLIGLYLIFGRFTYKRWNRRHTRYAISDQRIAVIRKGGRQVQSLARAEPFEIKRRRDGTHTTLLWQVPGLATPASESFRRIELPVWHELRGFRLACRYVAATGTTGLLRSDAGRPGVGRIAAIRGMRGSRRQDIHRACLKPTLPVSPAVEYAGDYLRAQR